MQELITKLQATTTILAAVAIFAAGRSLSASYAVTTIHFSALAVFVYREVLPLVFSHSPIDTSGFRESRIWVVVGILTWTGFLAPLSLPRFVIYSDPEVLFDYYSDFLI